MRILEIQFDECIELRWRNDFRSRGQSRTAHRETRCIRCADQNPLASVGQRSDLESDLNLGRRDGRPTQKSRLQLDRLSGGQDDRDTLGEIGIPFDRKRQVIADRQLLRAKQVGVRQQRDRGAARRGRRTRDELHTGSETLGRTRVGIEGDVDSQLRFARCWRAGRGERPEIAVELQVREAKTETLQPAPKNADRFNRRRRIGTPVKSFAKASRWIAEQGADRAPFDLFAQITLSQTGRRHVDQSDQSREAQQTTDRMVVAQQMLDKNVIEQIATDRRLERGYIQSARESRVGLIVNGIDRVDDFPDRVERLRSRHGVRIRADHVDYVRTRGREIGQRLRHR